MRNRDLMTMHLGALFTMDANSRLLSVNEPGGGPPAPRFFLGRADDGNLWSLAADLPRELTRDLHELCRTEPLDRTPSWSPRYEQAYIRLLETYAPVRNIWRGPAYRFPRGKDSAQTAIAITPRNAELLRGGFEKLLEEVTDWQPFYAVIEKKKAISVCRSVRISAPAHEAGVETLPEFRGKGHATAVVAVWARAVRSLGSEPLYSTSSGNLASQALARKLGLIQYGVDFHIE